MSVPKYCVENPVTVLMFFIGVIIIGVISLLKLPVELMPNTSFGNISIHIGVRGGMPPDEVETLVTRPIEEAVATTAHIRNIISTSKEGESSINIEFEPGTNMDFAGLEVREKFAKVKNSLPKEIEKPVIAKYQQSDVPVVILTLSSDKRTPEMLRKLVDDSIKEKFQRVDGVANIDVGGGQERKILMELDQLKLKQYGLNINQIINVVAVNNINLLLGELKSSGSKYLIRAMGDLASVEEIANLPVSIGKEGSIIRIKDLGVVKDTFLEPRGFARLNRKPVVSLYIQRESSGNTVKTAKAVLAMVETIKKELPADIKIKVISNQAEEIQKAITNVINSLKEGAFLTIFVLYVFLRSFKSTFVICTSIPIATVATFILLKMQGITLNVMTLSGLALGIGMLVDASIVVLENIYSYKERGLSNIRSAILGTEEVILAIVASTLTTIVVFIPIIFVNKKIQIQYSGLALTITYSLVISLMVGASLIPMLFSRLGSSKEARAKKRKDIRRKTFDTTTLFYKFRILYRSLLLILIRYRYRVILLITICFTVAIVNFTKIDMDLSEGGDTNKFTAFVELPSGAKLEKSDEIVKKVEKLFGEVPEVETYSSRIEGWSSKVYITLVPQNKRTKTVKQVIDELRPQVKNFKEAFIYFKEDAETSQKDITLDLYGYDYKVLKELAVSIASRLGTVSDFEDTKIRMKEGRPEMRIIVDKDACASYGLTTKEVADVIHAKMRGLRASTFRTEGRELEIVGRVREIDRNTFDKMKKMIIDTQKGETVYLEQVAKFDFDLGPSEIWRKDKTRMIQVSATRKVSLTKAVEKTKAALADMQFPEDYYYRFGSDFEELQENKQQMTLALGLTVLLIYMLLASLFESYYQPLMIMVAMPLALIGVTPALTHKHMSITMGVLIGLIMLGGRVVSNSIIIVSALNFFRKEKGYGVLKSILIVSQDRLRPIMMTAFTGIIGLLPMATDKGESAGLWAPLAITVVAGLTSSTFLDLLVLPCVIIIAEDIREFIKRSAHWINRVIFRKPVAAVYTKKA